MKEKEINIFLDENQGQMSMYMDGSGAVEEAPADLPLYGQWVDIEFLLNDLFVRASMSSVERERERAAILSSEAMAPAEKRRRLDALTAEDVRFHQLSGLLRWYLTQPQYIKRGWFETALSVYEPGRIDRRYVQKEEGRGLDEAFDESRGRVCLTGEEQASDEYWIAYYDYSARFTKERHDLIYNYRTGSVLDAIYELLRYMIEQNHHIKQCKNCGLFFVPGRGKQPCCRACSPKMKSVIEALGADDPLSREIVNIERLLQSRELYAWDDEEAEAVKLRLDMFRLQRNYLLGSLADGTQSNYEYCLAAFRDIHGRLLEKRPDEGDMDEN